MDKKKQTTMGIIKDKVSDFYETAKPMMEVAGSMKDMLNFNDKINNHFGDFCKDGIQTAVTSSIKNPSGSLVENITSGQKSFEALFLGTIAEGIVSFFKVFLK